jgi:hypothetical protein
MELYELRPDTDAFRPGWSLLSGRSRAALHTKAMAFDREAVFIGSFNLDPRSSFINTEAGLYIESPELAERLVAYMATGVVPDNSYRVLLDPNGEIVWETVKDGQRVRYQDEPEAGFRRRFRRRSLEDPTNRLATLRPIALVTETFWPSLEFRCAVRRRRPGRAPRASPGSRTSASASALKRYPLTRSIPAGETWSAAGAKSRTLASISGVRAFHASFVR